MTKRKFYCYVDESGQDTKGRLFVVSVVIGNREIRDSLENILEEIELSSGKRKKKWQKTTFQHRNAYLEKIIILKELHHALFTAHYETTKEYEALTTYTVAQAVNSYAANAEYKVTIIIDGLTTASRQRVMRHLHQLKIKYQKVVLGARDQSSALLRLADALAGLARDYHEGNTNAKKWIKAFIKMGLLTNLKD